MVTSKATYPNRLALTTTCQAFILLIFTSKLAQSLKLDPVGRPYDSTVDWLCAKFTGDRDIYHYMQGLAYEDWAYYLVYHDYVYRWELIGSGSSTDALWPNRPDRVAGSYVDHLESLGKWNEISWIKSILDANGIDPNSLKLIRLWIYTTLATKRQIEISLQRSSGQVDTLITTDGVTELRKDYMPECTISDKEFTYIFRYDDKGKVVASWRIQRRLKDKPIEKGPFYMQRNLDQLRFYSSLPQHYTPLFAQLPIYGLIWNSHVYLWDLPNHQVYYFKQANLISKENYETTLLKNVSFEKYFDCQAESSWLTTGGGAPSNYYPFESTTPKETPQVETQAGGPMMGDESNSEADHSQTVSQTHQPESNQSNVLLYFILLVLGFIVLILAIFLIFRRITKRKWKKCSNNNKSKKMKKRAKKGKLSQVSSSSNSLISADSSKISSTNKSKTPSSTFKGNANALKAKPTSKASNIRVSV